jgi:hypothetical protein
MGFSESFLQKHHKASSKYTKEGFLESFSKPKFSHDTANWSHADKKIRVRLATNDELVNPNDSMNFFKGFPKERTMESVVGSKTKAKQFHGLLEGDYEIATRGFYTNNLEGLKTLFQRYPEMFESIQTHEQFKMSEMLVQSFIEE